MLPLALLSPEPLNRAPRMAPATDDPEEGSELSELVAEEPAEFDEEELEFDEILLECESSTLFSLSAAPLFFDAKVTANARANGISLRIARSVSEARDSDSVRRATANSRAR